jgi:hypothetical protein
MIRISKWVVRNDSLINGLSRPGTMSIGKDPSRADPLMCNFCPFATVTESRDLLGM